MTQTESLGILLTACLTGRERPGAQKPIRNSPGRRFLPPDTQLSPVIWSAKNPMIQALSECRGLAHTGAFSRDQDRLAGAAVSLQEARPAPGCSLQLGSSVSRVTVLPAVILSIIQVILQILKVPTLCQACSMCQNSSRGHDRQKSHLRGAYILVGEAVNNMISK